MEIAPRGQYFRHKPQAVQSAFSTTGKPPPKKPPLF
jgi:hypothetical protein